MPRIPGSDLGSPFRRRKIVATIFVQTTIHRRGSLLPNRVGTSAEGASSLVFGQPGRAAEGGPKDFFCGEQHALERNGRRALAPRSQANGMPSTAESTAQSPPSVLKHPCNGVILDPDPESWQSSHPLNTSHATQNVHAVGFPCMQSMPCKHRFARPGTNSSQAHP